MHAAVGRAVRVILEACLAHGAIDLDEVGNGISRPERGGEGDLGIHRGARSSHGRGEMAAPAAVEIHARAQPGRDIVGLREIFETGREQGLLGRGQATEHSTGARWSIRRVRPGAGVAGIEVRVQHAHVNGEATGEDDQQNLDSGHSALPLPDSMGTLYSPAGLSEECAKGF